MGISEDSEDDYVLGLPKGTMLFEYRIEAVLGQGGFGITYLAVDTLLDEEVALKEYFPNDTAVRTPNQSARARSSQERETFQVGLNAFLEEARIIARFRHPNIMQVRRFFEAHGTGYIVLQFERGRSFETLAAAGPIPEAELVPIVSDILRGLEAVHERAILHRDIKPRNVIIRDDGTAVLIDFGAARDFTMRNTRTVTKMASPGYSPPEQYGVGSQQGPWSDFYALGAMMYRAVTGKVPADSLRRLRDDPLVPAVQAAEGRYSKPLLRLIDRMMQIDEHRRPASVAEIRAAVPALRTPGTKTTRETKAARADTRQGVSRDVSPDTSRTTWGEAPQRPRKRTGLWLGLAGLALLMTGGGAYWALRGPSPLTRTESQGSKTGGSTAASTGTDARDTQAAKDTLKDAKTAAAAPALFRDCPNCPEMAVLPPGRFLMGSDDGFPNESPAHLVVIAAPPAMGIRPVTFAEWDACIAGGGCDRRPDDRGGGRGDRPVVDVSWPDAQAYLAWLSQTTGAHYRLPSEAEWEYAARAGSTTAFWWGADAGESHANCADCLTPKPTAALATGRFAANPFGLFDTAGNVAQWVEDCWHDTYGGAPADGSAVTQAGCRQRVVRGGSFRSDWRHIRSAARARNTETTRSPALGFRVAREPSNPL